MGAKKKLLQVQEAFQLAQKPHQNHAKLVVALKSTYAQVRLLSGGPARGELRAPGGQGPPPQRFPETDTSVPEESP